MQKHLLYWENINYIADEIQINPFKRIYFDPN